MKLIHLCETYDILVESELILGKTKDGYMEVHPSVVVSTGSNWKLSSTGLELLKSKKIRSNSKITWTDESGESWVGNATEDQIFLARKIPKRIQTDGRDDRQLFKVMNALAHNDQASENIQYLKQHYPETIVDGIKMFRVLTVSAADLYKAKVKDEASLTQYIKSVKPGEYQSWSKSQKGIDTYLDKNITSNLAVPGSKSAMAKYPVFIILAQTGTGLDLTGMVDYLSGKDINKLKDAFDIDRTKMLKAADEVLSPVLDSVKILSIQVPYKQDGKQYRQQHEFGVDKVTNDVVHLEPNDISKVYKIRSQMKSQGTWNDGSNHKSHESRSSDPSSKFDTSYASG